MDPSALCVLSQARRLLACPYVEPYEPEYHADVAGVYFLVQNDGWIAYVGKAMRFGRRLPAHKHKGHSAVFVLAPRADLIDRYETAFIRMFRPELNCSQHHYAGRFTFADKALIERIGIEVEVPSNIDDFLQTRDYWLDRGRERLGAHPNGQA